MSPKKTNPLYVVKNNGKDVETATNLIEALFKKIGLEFVYEYFYNIVRSLLIKVNSTALMTVVYDFIEDYKQIIEMVDQALKRFQTR